MPCVVLIIFKFEVVTYIVPVPVSVISFVIVLFMSVQSAL